MAPIPKKHAPKAVPKVKAQRATATMATQSVVPPIRPLDDWRARTLARVRRLIRAADTEIVEERKWIKPSNPVGVPVWSRAGIVCTGETYKQVV